MAENKTQPTDASVTQFIAAIPDPRRRADAEQLLVLLGEVSGEPAVMWGPTIVGFGHYHYVYESGREGDAARLGFSPRKANLVVYIVPGFQAFVPIMARLGRYKTGRSCLYINKLADIDLEVLKELVVAALAWMDAHDPRR